ncbi:hypothetical protein [Salinicola rhizosphaerae]|uniref:DUF3617 family protein n=1 Tax=Salinicola rhizosphaerae TaxID=1443141 RepID=A0ABQ3EF62_9GAMM|nr:hypothetical protein [Salinicola rhizosphaerae]GHB32706.1 hypothetical protein GCM10009038_34510 [Salinicola rhizosphaerae]
MRQTSMIGKGLLGGATLLMLGACASGGPVQDSVTTYLNCDDLKKAIASADNGFDDIKRGSRTTRYGQIWNTSTQAFNNACSIVSASGPTYYTCSGRVESDAGESQLEAATDGIGQCLGSSWASAPAEDGAIDFRGSSGSPVLTLKSFENDRGAQMVMMRIDP